MRTILGNYVPEGDPEIFKFLGANWPLVCEWAGVSAPPLTVMARENRPPGLADAGMYDFLPAPEGPGCVLLNDEAILGEFYVAHIDPNGNVLGFLWGFLVSLVRSWMAHTGNLPDGDRLRLCHVAQALSRYPEPYRTAYLGNFADAAGSNPSDSRCAQYLATVAVWFVSPADSYDGAPLAAIVRARATGFNVALEPPLKLPPLE